MRVILIFIFSFWIFVKQGRAQVDTLKFIDGTYYVIDGDRIVYPDFKTGAFKIVESSAEFPGGKRALDNWLSQNIKSDSSLSSNVIVNAIFTINKKGLPTAVTVQGDTLHGRGLEVTKLIRKMPRWKPAQQSGNVVKMRLALPITFTKIEKTEK